MGVNDELFPTEITEQCDCIYIAKVLNGFNVTFRVEFMHDKASIFTRIIGNDQYNFSFNNQDHVQQLKEFINSGQWIEVPVTNPPVFSGSVKKFEKVKS